MKLSIKYVFVLILVSAIGTFATHKPKILIIGDSISLRYRPFVKRHFSSKAIVLNNPGNAQHTGTGVDNVKEWVGDGSWDMVQFNWGLWDLCYRHPDSDVQGHRDKINGQLTFNLESYRENLDTIVNLLKK